MNQLTMEDVEKMLGRLIMSQYQQEQQLTNYIKQLEERIQELEKDGSDTSNIGKMPEYG